MPSSANAPRSNLRPLWSRPSIRASRTTTRFDMPANAARTCSPTSRLRVTTAGSAHRKPPSAQYPAQRNPCPIRGFAATASIDQARGEYIARLHQHVVNMLGDAGGVVQLVGRSPDPHVADNKESVFAIETGESDVGASKRRGSAHGTWNLPFTGGYTPVAEACASAATDVGIVSNGIPQTRSSDRICGAQMQKARFGSNQNRADEVVLAASAGNLHGHSHAHRSSGQRDIHAV